MPKGKRITKKKRGRPATGQDPVRAVRLSNEVWDLLEFWRTAAYYPDVCTRSEFIRSLVIEGINRLNRSRSHANAVRATVNRIDAEGPTFTAEKEKAFTEAIKERRVSFEGACDLPWDDYFAYRDKHGCEPLNESDRAYAAAYSSCAVPQK
jgi:hypothetical protein